MFRETVVWTNACKGTSVCFESKKCPLFLLHTLRLALLGVLPGATNGDGGNAGYGGG